jgi:flagellar hook-basal body complex protein FliE
MAIQAISAVTPSLLQTSAPQAVSAGQQPSFADFLGQELDKVNQASQNADQLAQSYATGGNVTAAQLMVAEQQASMSVDMLTQVTNRVQDSYRTLMNMQV